MKERGILFSAPMVRALLDGSKTQTRRALKVQPIGTPHSGQASLTKSGSRPVFYAMWEAPAADGSTCCICPYGIPGDQLWVREAWRYSCSASTSTVGQFMHTIAYRADDARQSFGPMPLDDVGLPKQRDRREDEDHLAWDDYLTRYWAQFRPSIHMPRWASRIALEVTDVRVERLQDISEADAIAEGIVQLNDGGFGLPAGEHYHRGDPRESYFGLFESINGPGSVEANPFVWCVSFRRI